MKPETRIKKLFNRIKRKYKISQKFKFKINSKKPKSKLSPFMEIKFYKTKDPIINVYINRLSYRFEKISDNYIRNTLAHELAHFIVDKNLKEKDHKKLREALKMIERLIDER